MTMDLVTAHRLAHQIEWMHAKERARLMTRGRNNPNPEHEFDPLAATCLGDLIYKLANPRKGTHSR